MNLTQIIQKQRLPAMDVEAIAKISHLEKILMHEPQVDVSTTHVFHAGLYARTVRIPAGCLVTGALIKIDTILIMHGKVSVFIGDETLELDGFYVFEASAGRKQAFLAHSETELTMLFATQATSIDQVEAEFTDETDLLLSRKYGDLNLISYIKGESCPE
jgi:hypothetical protein